MKGRTHETPRIIGWVIVFVAASALALAACGGGESADVTTTLKVPGMEQSTSTSRATATTQVDAAAPELGATSWNVTDYGLSAGVLTNVWPDTEVTLRFGADGSVSGSTGCNDHSGSFEVVGSYNEFEEGVRDADDGQTIHIMVASLTEKTCSPDHVMEQEREILSLLEGVDRWFIARGELILRSADGFFLQAEPSG